MSNKTEIKPKLPVITEEDIKRNADATSFSRGLAYHRQGMIIRPAIRESMLSARCHGSTGEQYLVRVTLSSSKKAPFSSWQCTCPRGDFCKHIVALLLTWIETPDKFQSTAGLSERLGTCERDALIAIIQKFIDIEPGLMDVLDRHLATESPAIPKAKSGDGSAARVTINKLAIQKRLDQAVDTSRRDEVDEDSYYYDDYEGDHQESNVEAFLNDEDTDAESVFVEFLQKAEAFEASGLFADAAALFGVVALKGVERYRDLEGDALIETILSAARGLTRCLEVQKTLHPADQMGEKQRSDTIQAFYKSSLFLDPLTWTDDENHSAGPFDVYFTGPATVPAGNPMEVLHSCLSDNERLALDARWRTDAVNLKLAEQTRLAAISFGIICTGADALDQTKVLELLDQAALWSDKAEFLLRQGKVNDAVGVAARGIAPAFDFLQFAKMLAASVVGGAAIAIKMVDDRLWETEGKDKLDDRIYLDWLGATALAEGHIPQSLDYRFRTFRLYPSIQEFHDLKLQVELLKDESGSWEPKLASARKTLVDTRQPGIDMELLLEDGAIDAAIDLLENGPKLKPLFGQGPLMSAYESFRPRIVVAAEATRPDFSIQHYKKKTESAIAFKNRSSYEGAIPQLVALRRVLEANSRTAEWTEYIKAVRWENRRLIALIEVLDNAGLR